MDNISNSLGLSTGKEILDNLASPSEDTETDEYHIHKKKTIKSKPEFKALKKLLNKRKLGL